MSSMFTGVVVGVDASSSSRMAVRTAAGEAIRRQQPLRLLHVVQSPVATGLTPYAIDVDELMAAARAEVEEVAAEERAAHPGLDVSTLVVCGSPAGTLIEASRTAGLVVVGCRGQGGFAELLLGSVSSQLSAHAKGPVLVVRPLAGQADATWPVIVGVDGSPTSQAAIGFAFAEASARGVPLVAVYVGWAPSMDSPDAATGWSVDAAMVRQQGERVLAEATAGWSQTYPEVTVVHRLIEDPDEEGALVEASRQAVLVVVGSRGRGGFRGLLLGSVGQALVHHAHCPVAVVHPVPAGVPA